ncbi:Cytochrome P450 [Corchorus olitorius]|uniref:Cytochrome P450 n=1 Tax=Corchorus olitorius TaxID=93759 RepID=A0A1R3KXJ7_9ROSI|nr:Cytochrome P450 [Corchorus olitorius]
MEVEMVIAVFIGLLALFFGHWYRNRNSLITNWPAVGMLPSLIRNSGRTLDFITNDILRRCGGTFEFKGPLFSNFNFILTTDPMNVNHILSKNFANYEKGSQLREILEPFGEGVFTADSDPWKIQRKIMQALIGSNKFSLYRDKVVREKLVKVVPSREAVADMEEAMRQRHFLPASFWKVQKWLQIGDGKKLIKARKTLDDFVYRCISLRIEKLRRNKLGQVEEEEEEFDLLASFLGKNPEDPDPDAFEQHSDKFLRDTAVNLYLAGHGLKVARFEGQSRNDMMIM